jgi:hypothetical protein
MRFFFELVGQEAAQLNEHHSLEMEWPSNFSSHLQKLYVRLRELQVFSVLLVCSQTILLYHELAILTRRSLRNASYLRRIFSIEALSSLFVKIKSSTSLEIIDYRFSRPKCNCTYSLAASQTCCDLRWARVAVSTDWAARDIFTIPCMSRPVCTVSAVSPYIECVREVGRKQRGATSEIDPVAILARS